jgi:peptidylprolyl isomerase
VPATRIIYSHPILSQILLEPFGLAHRQISNPKKKGGNMAQAKNGDNVRVHYTGKLDDGTVFDSSRSRDPLQFVIGENQVIPRFEQEIVGMNQGDTKSFDIPSDQAYGPHRKEMVMEVGREHLPPDMKPEIGQRLQLSQQDAEPFIVTVTKVNKSGVTLDANHPLAGKDLSFDVELVEIA